MQHKEAALAKERENCAKLKMTYKLKKDQAKLNE